MRFTQVGLAGAVVVDLERIEDERGFFARSWSSEEFTSEGLEARLVACSVSFNRAAGTLRGMHYQTEPHGEVKLVRCTSGAVFDVIIDLRPTSPTYLGWFGTELSAHNRTALYVPAGFAHGFQTTEPDSEVLYQMSSPHVPAAARGVRWDDPAFGVAWPEVPVRVINDRDRAYPDFSAEAHRA